MKTIDVNGTRAYQFESFDANAVDHGIYTRLGGVSEGIWKSLNTAGTVGDDKAAIAQNHEISLALLGDPWQRVLMCGRCTALKSISRKRHVHLSKNICPAMLFLRIKLALP